ncbi:MAG: phosphoglucosamine mutase, partial [Actinomycetota bacterium]
TRNPDTGVGETGGQRRLDPGARASGVPTDEDAAGAEVTVMAADPDGTNINAGCGATHPEALAARVGEVGADLGLALDGDADRVIAVDEHGAIVDGDVIMTALALDLADRGALASGTVVVTVMSNLGLRRALADAGITVVETPVGDRHVVAAMGEVGAGLGGEQSGHIVLPAHATTGDGTLTGLLLADLVRRSGRPLSAHAARMPRFPQRLVNVRIDPVGDLRTASRTQAAIAESAARLGANGRVLVRASGTEPLVRIMVEAPSVGEADAVAARLEAVVRAVLGAADGP